MYLAVKQHQGLVLFIMEMEILRKHCAKYAEIRAFSDLYFPVYGQKRIRIFSHMARIGDIRDFADIRKNTDQRTSVFRYTLLGETP